MKERVSLLRKNKKVRWNKYLNHPLNLALSGLI